jgi:hypothetical protein
MISLKLNRCRPHALPGPGPGPVPLLVLLVMMAGATAVPAAGPAPVRTGREGQAREIIGLIRQDRRDEALPLCRSYTERFPDDRIMLYNQACLENRAGLPAEAAVTFGKAVGAGFDDFAGAFADPDLAGLERNPLVARLFDDHRDRLAGLAAGRAVSLSWQEASDPLRLTEDLRGPTPDQLEIRLTWTPTGLVVVLEAGPPWSTILGPGNVAPWNGGSGLVFTLGIPDGNSTGEFQTANHFLFAFGMENDLAVGATYLAGQDRWQPVAELQPKMRLDEAERLELRAAIPWAAILPYNPLVDDRLGCNAAVRLAGPEGFRSAAVLADPAAFRPKSPVRRIIPLVFSTASVKEEIFAGKSSLTISGEGPVTIELAAVSPAAGTGALTIDFLGGPAQSLLPEGQVSQPVALSAGLNRLTRQADFSALKTGAYVIKAALTFPSGRTLTWGSTVLQLAPGWREAFLDRIEQLDQREQPTALFHLDTIAGAIAGHQQRRSPGAIVTTINQLGSMLDDAQARGTILPDKGPFLAVYPGPDGNDRLCDIYLPAKWEVAAALNPVLMLTASPDLAVALSHRLGQNYEQGRQLPTFKAGTDQGFPLYLVPRPGPLDGNGPVDLTAEAEAALAWVLDSFQVAAVSVAGTDRAAGAALQLARRRPEALKALIIFAGGDLDPWPQADAAFIGRELSGFPARLPVTWADFVSETREAGQGPLILRALQDLGADIVEVIPVRGGLNFTQTADRTVLWAEGLR